MRGALEGGFKYAGFYTFLKGKNCSYSFRNLDKSTMYKMMYIISFRKVGSEILEPLDITEIRNVFITYLITQNLGYT